MSEIFTYSYTFFKFSIAVLPCEYAFCISWSKLFVKNALQPELKSYDTSHFSGRRKNQGRFAETFRREQGTTPRRYRDGMEAD